MLLFEIAKLLFEPLAHQNRMFELPAGCRSQKRFLKAHSAPFRGDTGKERGRRLESRRNCRSAEATGSATRGPSRATDWARLAGCNRATGADTPVAAHNRPRGSKPLPSRA